VLARRADDAGESTPSAVVPDAFGPTSCPQVWSCESAIGRPAWLADLFASEIVPRREDLQAAFGLGESDKHISTIDSDGIALAAIQWVKREA